MKIFDLLKIGIRDIKGRWVVLPIIGIAISTFCLCFAGAILTTVQKEKSVPYELSILGQGTKKITSSTLAEISKLSDITDVTPLLNIETTVRTGKYSANMNLIGVKDSYIKGKFAAGGVFPSSSGMPYIVLNKAACKEFTLKQKSASTNTGGTKTGSTTVTDTNSSDTKTSSETETDTNTGGAETASATGNDTNTSDTKLGNATVNDTNTGGAQVNNLTDTNTDTEASSDNDDDTTAPKIDWLNASISLDSGEAGHLIISKICGILDGDDKQQKPEAYISLSSAKNLLLKSGQSTDYVGAYVRIKNIGVAGIVSKDIEDLGFTVDNTNDLLQSKWDIELKEMVYLIVIGIFSLLCSTVLMITWRKISIIQQKEEWKMLRLIGMKEKYIFILFVTQSIIVLLIGFVIGIIVSISTPSFLSPDIKETSVYALPIPFLVSVLIFVICIVVSMLPLFNKKGFTSDLD